MQKPSVSRILFSLYLLTYYDVSQPDSNALINFKTIDTNLLNSISRSYFEYNLINRTLDIANYSGKFALVGNNTLGLVQAEINRSESLLKMMTLRNKDRHITGSCRSVSTLLR